MKIFAIPVLSLLFLFYSGEQSQAKEPEIQFGHISVEHELSQNTIHCILQDRLGFMWFGTYNGLNKYDGYTFTVYNQDVGDRDYPSTSGCGVMLALYEDQAGTLWIGTGCNGLQKFDRETGQFTYYSHELGNPNSLSHNIVLSIYEDRFGDLWIGTAKGLNRFDRSTEQFVRYRAVPENPYSLYNDQIQTIYEDHTGTLWIGTLNGLHRFNRETKQFVRYQHDFNNPHSLSHNGIKVIYEDHTGTLWVGTNGGGLNRFIRETEQFIHYRRDPVDPNSLSNDTVWAIYEDHTETLWIGTLNGLNRFDREIEQFTVYRTERNNPYSLSHNEIISIYEDRSGVLWIGTAGGGLNTYIPQIKQFHLYTSESNNPNSLSSPDVTAIYEDHKGVLWVGTKGGGLNKVDREKGQSTHYKPDPANPRSLSGGNVSAIYEDDSGRVWVGTYEGLNKFDQERGQFIRYTHDPEDPHSLSHDVVLTILQDRSGVLWIGTGGGGLNRFDPQTKQFRYFLHNPADPQSLSHNEIRSMYEDTSGVIWIGTFGGGLNAFYPKREQFVHYQHDDNDPHSLSHNVVLALYEDRSGVLWVGTRKGLDKFDRTTYTFTHYGKQEGLSSNLVLGILEDTQGNLWLSTLKGLSKFNPRTETFTNYTVRDGLQSNRFNQAAFKSQSGEMFFGGVKGFNAFYPENIKDRDILPVPPVVLTSFTQGGEPINPGEPAETFRKITLDWRYNFFEFEFAVLNYIHPKKNQYAYMLEGFDNDWNYTGPGYPGKYANLSGRFGKYTNLPSGTYTLRIKGSNHDGVWNEEGTSIPVYIKPPPWKTWWAYSLYVLIPGVALLGYTRYIVKRRQLEESIRLIVEGTASATGDEFFRSLARNLASALHTRFVLVSECVDSAPTKGRTLAFWTGSEFSENFEYDLNSELHGTTGKQGISYYPIGVQTRFADDELIATTNAESYVSVPLIASSGTVIGHIIVMHDRPMKNRKHTLSVLKIFAARAEAELARKRIDRALKASLQEKELLLKEVHHRVKNNLQIISSLLGIQAGQFKAQSLLSTTLSADSGQVISAFKESQNRIRSIALIHEKLYRSHNLAKIDFAQYIKDLGTYLFTTYGVDPNAVTLNVHAEDVLLNIDAAIPCGMIINELISNALQYAFLAGKIGEISITLSTNDHNEFTLRVHDTGIGFPENIDVQNTQSLGLKLVNLFTEQLDGTLILERNNGTVFTITFPG